MTVRGLAQRYLRANAASGAGPLLSILPAGPSAAQVAAGALYTAAGGLVSCTRATGKYCRASDGSLVLLSANQPSVESEGLLVEGTGENLFTRSDAFANAAWTKSLVTVTSNATTSPEGSAHAEMLTDNSTNSFHYVRQTPTLSAVNNNAVSVYAKAGTCRYVTLCFSDTGANAAFDLQAGAVLGVSGVTAYVQSAGNGWWRCVMVGHSDIAADDIYIMMNPSGSTPSLPSYAGAGSTLYVWGAQAEISQSWASSYIQTAGASATRDADIVSVANPYPSGSVNFAIGCTLQPMAGKAWNTSATRFGWCLGEYGSANTAACFVDGAANVRLQVTDNASGTKTGTVSQSFASSSQHRIVQTLTGSTQACYLDGVAQSVSMSGAGTGALSTMRSTLWLGGTDSSNQCFGWLQNFKVGKTYASAR
jgi:hypothetical protein